MSRGAALGAALTTGFRTAARLTAVLATGFFAVTIIY
jgi:hypothetical protein